MITELMYDNFDRNQGDKITLRLNQFTKGEDVNQMVKLRGLPYSVTAEDIMTMFKQFKIQEENIKIELILGRVTGFALVDLGSQAKADKAIQELHKYTMGVRYIEVMPVEQTE